VLLHIPFGVAIGFAYLVHWSLVLALTALFLVYELNEDGHTKDAAWKDLYGAIVGLELFLLIVLAYKLFGITAA